MSGHDDPQAFGLMEEMKLGRLGAVRHKPKRWEDEEEDINAEFTRKRVERGSKTSYWSYRIVKVITSEAAKNNNNVLGRYLGTKINDKWQVSQHGSLC